MRWLSYRRVCVALVVMTGLGGCLDAGGAIGVRLRRETRFESEWRRYRDLPGEKALALAGDRHGRYVSGQAYGHSSLTAAITGALERCEQRRSDRRITFECQVYAVGNNRMDGSVNAE